MPTSGGSNDLQSKEISHTASLTSTLIELYKEKKDGDLLIFQRLIHEMLHCKNLSITDRYASVLLYLHLFSKHTIYDDFLKLIEKESFDSDTKARELALLYGALINSGCVFTWSTEVQMAVIRRLLSLVQMLQENDGLAFDFLTAYLSKVKQVKWNVNDLVPLKLDNVTPRYLHMLCMVEAHSTLKSKKLKKLLKTDTANLALIVLKSSDYPHVSDLCSGVIEKLYEDKDNLVLLWETMLNSLNQMGSVNMFPLVLFLSKVIDMTKPEDANTLIPRFFSLGAGRVFSKNCDNFPEEIMKSFLKGFRHISEEVKLVIIKSVLTETEKLRDMSMGQRIVTFLKSDLDFASIKDLCKFYQSIISGSLKRTIKVGDDIKEMDFTTSDRNTFVASYGKLLAHPNCLNEVAWRTKCLKYLFLLGYATSTNDDEEDNIPGEVIGTARKVFFSAINNRFPRLVDFVNTLDKIMLVAGKNITNKKINVAMSSQVHTAWKTGQKCLAVLVSGEIEEDLAVILQVLLLYMMLLLFKDQVTARDAISEIDKVLKNVNLDKSLHWTEVLVDLFLQLLSASGQCHRHIVECVFGHLSPHMTPKALNQILNVLSDEQEESEELSDNDAEEGSSESEADDEENSNAEDSDESEEIDETPNDRLRGALRDELYQMDTASTAGSINLDDLDEEEGKHLNEALGKVFKLHGKVPLSKEEKQLKIHFKIRALLLLEIELSHDPPVEFILKIISKLVNVLKEALVDKDCYELSSKIKRVLTKCCSLKKFPIADECSISSDDLERCMLDSIKSDCPTSVFHDISKNIQEVLVLLVRIAYCFSIDPAPLTNILHGILNSYFTQSDSIYPSHFVVSLLSSQSPCIVSLIPSLVYFAFSPTVKSLKKTIAMECLIIFFKESQFFQKNEQNWDSIDVAVVKLVKKIKKCIEAVAKKEIELNPSYGIALFDLICLVNNRSQQLGLDKNELRNLLAVSPELPPFQGKLKRAYVRCVASLTPKEYQKNPSKQKKPSPNSAGTPLINGTKEKGNAESDDCLKSSTTPSKKSKKKRAPSESEILPRTNGSPKFKKFKVKTENLTEGE